MEIKKRMDNIDIARGLTILLVVVGHTSNYYGTSIILFRWIYSFHMPLFFILSGYFFKPGGTFTEAVRKTVKHTLLPYFSIHLVRCVIAFFTLGFSRELINNYLLPVLYGSNASVHRSHTLFPVKIVGMTWFFLALFWCRIFYFCLNKLAEQYHISIWLLVIALALFSIELNDKIWLPFSIQPGISALVFYQVGRWMRENKITEKPPLPYGALIAAIILWLFCAKYQRLSLAANTYPGIGSFIGAVTGTYLIIMFSGWLMRFPALSRFFRWCGTNSMAIYCFHSIEGTVPGYHAILRSAVESVCAIPSKKAALLFFIPRVCVLLLCAWIFSIVQKKFKKTSR